MATQGTGKLAELGPVMQISYVTEDLEKSIRWWTETVGVGPFFMREHIPFDTLLYRGQPADIDFSMAIGYWGDVQIELICQHNDAPSIYRDWQQAGMQGVQHLCIVVDDVAEARKRCLEAGMTVLQEGTLGGGSSEVIYVDSGGGPGTMLEYIRLPEAGLKGFEMMRQAARDWDGSDPMRRR